MAEPDQPQRKQVALFITCLTDQFYPRVGVAVTKILEHFGWDVVFPPDQTCCGQPFYNNGLHPEAADLARRMIRIFQPYPYVVTPSGSCCAMVREHFPKLLANDPNWKSAAEKFAASTYEFVEFLDKVLHVDLSGLNLPAERTVTYHYTCHLRGIGATDQSIRLLKQLGNLKFAPLEKSDQCCGFGGTFAVNYPHISGSIVQDKVQCIAQTQAQTVVCNDAGCTMNIAGMCNRQGVPTEVKHIAELISEAIGMDTNAW